MHGIARVRTTEEEKLKKKKERETELSIFKTQVANIFEKRSNKIFDNDALKLTADVLSRNPDISTIWNYRREIILELLNRMDDVETKTVFDNDLRLTESCLKVNPKSYCAWHHRLWVLQNRKDANWDIELKLCTAFLKLDERNFHCWNYRDHVVANSEVKMHDEYEYSLKKILENFSNYSAWHYRSKLLLHLFSNNTDECSILEEKHKEELELVINAAFTDPNDSSAWFYQRWLLGSSQNNIVIVACKITKTEILIAFNKNVNLNDSGSNIFLNDVKIIGNWQSIHQNKYNVLWTLKNNENTFLNCSNGEINVKYIDNNGWMSIIKCDYFSDAYVGYGLRSFKNNFGQSVITALESQFDIYEQLLELEPDNKWALLTYATLKHSIDHIANYDACRDILKRLQSLDSKRVNYYKDLMARWHIEYILDQNVSIDAGIFYVESEKERELSTLYHTQYWSVCLKINLRGFKLTNSCLSRLMMFQSCEILDLGNNIITSLTEFPSLPKLKTLYIDGNDLNNKDLFYLQKCSNLQKVFYSNVEEENLKFSFEILSIS